MRRPIVDKLEAQRLAKSALARAGLPISHEALSGIQAGIALETVLRTWAIREGYDDKPDNTLGNVLGFLARHKMVSDGEHKQLMTDLLVRNHCAHGRWARLNPGQVTHLIENSLRWCDRLAVQGVIAAPLPMIGGDILFEESPIAPKPRRTVAWAFSGGSLKLNGLAGYALMVQFLVLFSTSLAISICIAIYHLGTQISLFADLVAGRKAAVSPLLLMATMLTMLGFLWLAAFFFRDGLWRLMNVDRAYVSPPQGFGLRWSLIVAFCELTTSTAKRS